MANLNDGLHLSQEGYTALRLSEGVVMHYYNDGGNNCTWGIGTLAHHGPCTPEELARTVLPKQANAVLHTRVLEAERQIKAVVTNRALTQTQFDAAVSFAYNSRTANIRQTLGPANQGDMNAVAEHMSRNVYITPRDQQGRSTGAPRLSRGLQNRRRREAAPFQQGGR